MWELYDDMLAGIPDSAVADEIIVGSYGAFVRSGDGVGICGAMDDSSYRGEIMPKRRNGMPLRELAGCIKSWDFIEAELGMAAINAWYNAPERLIALGIDVAGNKAIEDRKSDPFIQMQKDVRGKRATVIGHFPYIDQLFAPVCELSVIEKFYPKEGDYPEQAADYLLPESDYVFISCYTVVEKSLPRFLELSKKAHVTIVGPATPCAPVLRKYGAHDFAGFVVTDNNFARDIVCGLGGNMHSAGHKVNYRSEL
jgi:uncharacterized protein (DUF4213/DUF364 family)